MINLFEIYNRVFQNKLISMNITNINVVEIEKQCYQESRLTVKLFKGLLYF
jgi:hypothetical protein